MTRSGERGNILFLILLAVILFAALSYAVTSSMRGGGKDVNNEKNDLYAGEILNYLTNLELAVNRMVLNGVRPEHLEFQYPDLVDQGANNNCSTSNCEVFDPSGGGIAPMPLPKKMFSESALGSTWLKTGNGDRKNSFNLVSVKDVGTTLPDIVVRLWGVNENLCDLINVKMGVYAQGSSYLNDGSGVGTSDGTSNVDWASFQGNLDPFPALTANVLGDADDRIASKTTFCLWKSNHQGGGVHHVLYAR